MAAQVRQVIVTPSTPPGGWATASGFAAAELSEAVTDTSVLSDQGTWDTRMRFAPFDGTGTATLTLLCTDDPAVQPPGATWKIWWVIRGETSPVQAYQVSTALPAQSNLAGLTPSSTGPIPQPAYNIDGGHA